MFKSIIGIEKESLDGAQNLFVSLPHPFEKFHQY